MPPTEAQKRASAKYHKTHIHRVSLDLQNEFYDIVKEAADKAGESVSMYIKNALLTRMQSEKD